MEEEAPGSARGPYWRQPVMRGQDLLSPLRQFQRRVAVIGSVAYLIANNPGGLLAMSRGGGDRGKVKPWNLLIRRGGGRDLGGRPGCA